MPERSGVTRKPKPAAVKLGAEPSLTDLLRDPMIRAVMASDGVSVGELRELLGEVARRAGAVVAPDFVVAFDDVLDEPPLRGMYQYCRSKRGDLSEIGRLVPYLAVAQLREGALGPRSDRRPLR